MSVKALKKQLKTLKQEKGVVSRKVGEAKKSGADASAFINEVKAISNNIRQIEAQLKEMNEAANKTAEPVSSTVTPPQFSPVNVQTDTSSALQVQIHQDQSSWDEYVQQHDNATIYHSWNIKNTIEKSFQHKTYYLSVSDEKQQIQGVLPLIALKSALFGHSLVSVPFFNYGGLLYSNTKAKDVLLNEAITLAKQLEVSHIEFRDCHKNEQLPCKEEKVSMLLNLPKTTDELWQNLGTKLRAQIKKAQKNQFVTQVGTTELVDDFYKIFARNMRDLGTPVYSKKLFIEMLANNSSARIVVVYHRNKPVSTGFIVGWKNTMEIPWASTIRSANKLDANMYLYWEILKYTTEQGYAVFDFGRSSKDANTFKFKKQWGAQAYPLFWHYWLPNNQALPEINPNNPKYKLMIYLWKKLPIWLSKLLGPNIVKHLP